MIRSGLTSITFRKLSPEEIVRLTAEAGLDGIEWGGDVHVPPGEVDTARRVASMTSEAGLAVSSYGSYYRVGHDEPGLFAPVLETAIALGAPIIRVWAGRVASREADEAYRA
ncbi:MAG: sugar phosphate isomerase/epimerase family protein, partial [Planctomycetota bacterium]